MVVVSLSEENDSESQLAREDEKEWSESHRGFLAYMKIESLLVECVGGQGLTILPPPLPNNNFLNYLAERLRW